MRGGITQRRRKVRAKIRELNSIPSQRWSRWTGAASPVTCRRRCARRLQSGERSAFRTIDYHCPESDDLLLIAFLQSPLSTLGRGIIGTKVSIEERYPY